MSDDKHKDKYLYAHTGCCNAHWEVVYDTETKGFHLECEQCGRMSSEFTVEGPEFEHPPTCDCCKQEDMIDKAMDDIIGEERDEDEEG